jgi:flavin reductase (DIM6/NTAB) family NADH-FMN oxidoreductase RutF
MIEPESLRHIMRQWATGVSLVTSIAEGFPHGMTVTSFTSVSLKPAIILVSLEKTTRTHRMVEQGKVFAVALLAEDQQELADRFAGRIADHEDRFAGLTFTSAASGAPIPAGSLAYLDCRVAATYSAGTHTLFLGEVLAGEVLRHAPPLLYHDRAYRSLKP